MRTRFDLPRSNSKSAHVLLLLLLTFSVSACTTQSKQEIVRTVGNQLGDFESYAKETKDDIMKAATNTSYCQQQKIETVDSLVRNIREQDPAKIKPGENLSYSTFTTLADSINSIAVDINRNLDISVPRIEKSQETFSALSKETARHTPLIDEYNAFIESVKAYNYGNNSDANAVIEDAVALSFAAALISTGALASPSWNIVNKAWRNSGLTKLALKYPKTVSASLSIAHWEVIRTPTINQGIEFFRTTLDNADEVIGC